MTFVGPGTFPGGAVAAPEPKKSGIATAPAIAIAVAIVLGLVLLAAIAIPVFLGARDRAQARSEEFAKLVGSGHAKTYVIEEAGFEAAFPVMPDRQVHTESLGSITATVTLYVAEKPDRAWVVSVLDLEEDVPFDLDAALDASAEAANGSVVERTIDESTDSIYGVIESEDGFVGTVIIRTRDRVYEVLVGGEDNPPEGFDEFVESFELL